MTIQLTLKAKGMVEGKQRAKEGKEKEKEKRDKSIRINQTESNNKRQKGVRKKKRTRE